MMAEKKRFEEEAKQKQIEAEMEQELKRQAQLKLQQQQNQKAVYEMFFYALLAESCFSLSTTCICNSSILKYLYYCRPFLRRPFLALFWVGGVIRAGVKRHDKKDTLVLKSYIYRLWKRKTAFRQKNIKKFNYRFLVLLLL